MVSPAILSMAYTSWDIKSLAPVNPGTRMFSLVFFNIIYQ